MILMNSSLGLVNLGFKVFSSITDEFKRPKKYIMMIVMTKSILVIDDGYLCSHEQDKP